MTLSHCITGFVLLGHVTQYKLEQNFSGTVFIVNWESISAFESFRRIFENLRYYFECKSFDVLSINFVIPYEFEMEGDWWVRVSQSKMMDIFSQSNLFFAVKIFFRSQNFFSQSEFIFAVRIYFRSQIWFWQRKNLTAKKWRRAPNKNSQSKTVFFSQSPCPSLQNNQCNN